jgi:peroxiredoxin Q/BCP
MVAEGEKAPDFVLEGSDGKTHGLREFGGRYLVLYFYPRDDTPGCTAEACSFRDSISEIRREGAEVVGVSRDPLESHAKFRSKFGLNFLLLSDPEGKTIKEYGAYGSRGVFGMGTLRKTFVIDGKGRIVKIYDKVSPKEHGGEILGFLGSVG